MLTPTPPSSHQPITVIDVGGTHLRWARWTPEGGLGEVSRRPSPSLVNCPGIPVGELRDRLIAAISQAVPRHSVAGVSFGAALDHRDGTVYASAPLWGAHAGSFDLMGTLTGARPDVQWHIVNDVTAALLDLASKPAAASKATGGEPRKVLLATISTGIACRVIDRRRGTIPVDGCGLQGEIGHLPARTTLDDAPVTLRCDCGMRDHLAAFSSGPGMRRLAAVQQQRTGRRWASSRLGRDLAGTPLTFEHALSAALDAGDAIGHDLLRAATGPVADVLRTALCLDPEIDLVALTGGVAVGLRAHYRRALLDHVTRAGLYLTSVFSPEWVTDRILVCGPDEANCLVGAGIAAVGTDRYPQNREGDAA